MPDKDKEDLESGRDLFVLNRLYPEAEATFTFRLKPLEEIKDVCHIVIDTNALLVPYIVSKESLEQIRQTYETLIGRKRLVIPGQVAREFARNRANKISERYQQLVSRKDKYPGPEGEYPLLLSLQEYGESIRLEKDIAKLSQQYRKSIEKVLDRIGEWRWNDPVSKLYSELFGTEVIYDLQYNEDEMKRDFHHRKRNNIPPGYKDVTIGDLLIWQTILEIGKNNRNSVIFVSGDEKADWYHRSSNRVLYPRYELVDEFRRASGGHSFHIIKISRLLELFGASDRVIDEVKREETQGLIQRSPLFISYSQEDRAFVDKLVNYLNDWGLRVWLDVHELAAGRLHTQIDRAMRVSPTVLLVLSRNSTESDWVMRELALARAKEKQMGRGVLCPIALDDSWKTCNWPAQLKEILFEYNILDFSKWEDDQFFLSQCEKLVEGLMQFYI